MATRTKARKMEADLEPLPEGEDLVAATPKRGWTPEKLKGFLVKRFYTRFHMSLILMSCGLMGMLTSWVLLHAGVQSMLARYPVVICVAYLTFLTGVWVWLRYVGVEGGGEGGSRRSATDNGLDLGDLVPSGRGGGGSGGISLPRGGGGGFDGGGASASWVQAEGAGAANLQTGAFAALSDPGAKASSGGSSNSSSGFSGFDLDFGGDGEGLVLVILAVALIAVIFAASGYLIWFAPDILGEAAFGAVLAGGLDRRSRNQDALGWVSGVVKKTWWPFALVLVFATGFAYWAGKYYPGTHTFKEALGQVITQSEP